jgi:hypothetical protein
LHDTHVNKLNHLGGYLQRCHYFMTQ